MLHPQGHILPGTGVLSHQCLWKHRCWVPVLSPHGVVLLPSIPKSSHVSSWRAVSSPTSSITQMHGDRAPAHPRDGETEASTGCLLPIGWSDAVWSRRTWWQLGATPGPSGSEGVRVARAEEMGEPWPGSHSPPPAAPPPRSCLTPRQAGRGATIAVPIAGRVPVPTMLRLLLLCVALGCGAEQAGKARTR